MWKARKQQIIKLEHLATEEDFYIIDITEKQQNNKSQYHMTMPCYEL